MIHVEPRQESLEELFVWLTERETYFSPVKFNISA